MSLMSNIFRLTLLDAKKWLLLGTLALVPLWLGSFAAAAHAEAEPCPNESLRSQLGSGGLPDCRAYEMVTPSYKEGYSAFVEAYSPNGNEAMLTSYGAFAGVSGEGENPEASGTYLVNRTSTGWRTKSLNAPLSEFIGQLPLAFEAESGAMLWDQHTPQQSAFTRGLYIRSAEGAYTYVGRLNPNIVAGEEESNVIETHEEYDYDRPLAATRNYEHIMVFAPAPSVYWKEFEGKAFDTTEGAAGSLYEYSGVDNEKPTLVGVEGEKGSTSLIGKCGTALGSGLTGSEYNALSAGGESVIFTVEPQGADACSATAPATAELFVRWYGSRTTASRAVTLHVSENECTEECGEESGKNFEGAAENGERIFFTSTQKLTDNATNGTESSGNASSQAGCGKALGHGGCNLYEFEGGPEGGHALSVVAGGDEVLGVVGVADDGERVYFVAAKTIPSSGKNVYGVSALEGEHNLYVYDAATKVTSFVTTLAPGESDEGDWKKPQNGRKMEIAGKSGEFLLFPSSATTIVPGEEAKAEQLYEYDALTGELVRVSKSEDGGDGNGLEASTRIQPAVSFVADFRSSDNPGNLAEDGLTVVFESSAPISDGAVAAGKGCSSVYEFRAADRISEGVVSLVSDGRDVQPDKGAACGATFQGMDSDGDNILFSTADALLPGDVNGVERDVYDARVDGGFPPVSAGTSSCDGSGCEGSVSSPSPVFGAPASATLTGAGNLVPPAPAPAAKVPVKKQVLKCPKGKKLDKARTCKTVSKKRVPSKKVDKTNRRNK